MVEEINSRAAPGVIISVEDPIEYVFASTTFAGWKQREIGTDTKSFPEALRHVLRQDPGRHSHQRNARSRNHFRGDYRGGNRVTSSWRHCTRLTRRRPLIVSWTLFRPDQQSQIIAQLANALQAIVAQRLLPRGRWHRTRGLHRSDDHERRYSFAVARPPLPAGASA